MHNSYCFSLSPAEHLQLPRLHLPPLALLRSELVDVRWAVVGQHVELLVLGGAVAAAVRARGQGQDLVREIVQLTMF